MAAGDDLFLEMRRSAPMFGRAGPPPYVPDFNPGFLGQNPLMTMGANAVLGQFLGGRGYLPSRSSGGPNLYDQGYAKDYFLAHQRAISAAADADRAADIELIRGGFRAAGRPWTADARKFADTVADGVAAASPLLAQMAPETWDSLGGRAGRAAVLSDAVHRAGRYAVDPVTGRSELSAESAGAMSAEIRRRLVGPGGDLGAFRGLSMGRAGLLYEELQSRGLAGAPLAGLDGAGRAAALAGDRGLLEGQLEDLRRRDPAKFADLVARSDLQRFGNAAGARGAGRLVPEQQARALLEGPGAARDAVETLRAVDGAAYEGALRNFDAKAVAGRLKSLSGAVRAMQDIFGDAGHPDAPMAQIVQKLNDLTQGGLATMDPATLERSVRKTQALARNTGLGIDALEGLTAHAAAATDALGLDRKFAVQVAQGAAAFGQGFGQGPAAGASSFFAADRERMTLLDNQLRARAAASGLANQLGTAARIDDALRAAGGGLAGPGAALARAVREGKTTFVDPRTGAAASVFQTDRDFRATMRASGVDEATLTQFASQRGANQEAILRYGIGDTVRDNAQGESIRGFLAQAQRSSFAAAFAASGIAGPRGGALAGRAADVASRTLMTMDEADRRDGGKRDAAVAAAVRKDLGREVAGVSDRALVLAADGGFGAFNEIVRRDPRLRGYETGLTAIEAQDLRAGQRRRRSDQEAGIQAAIRTELAGVGQAGPLARFVDAMRDPNLKGAGDLAAQALGGVKPEEIKAAMGRLRGKDDGALAAMGVADRGMLEAMSDDLLKQAEAAQAAAAGGPDRDRRLKAAADAVARNGVGADPAARDAVGPAVKVAVAATAPPAGGAAAAAVVAGPVQLTGRLVLEGLEAVLLKGARLIPSGGGSTPVAPAGTMAF